MSAALAKHKNHGNENVDLLAELLKNNKLKNDNDEYDVDDKEDEMTIPTTLRIMEAMQRATKMEIITRVILQIVKWSPQMGNTRLRT